MIPTRWSSADIDGVRCPHQHRLSDPRPQSVDPREGRSAGHLSDSVLTGADGPTQCILVGYRDPALGAGWPGTSRSPGLPRRCRRGRSPEPPPRPGFVAAVRQGEGTRPRASPSGPPRRRPHEESIPRRPNSLDYFLSGPKRRKLHPRWCHACLILCGGGLSLLSALLEAVVPSLAARAIE